MAQLQSNGIVIECVQGNIAEQPDIVAIVNAANAALRTGGGVAGAIHRAAGSALETECRQLAPIHPGQAVITGAHQLPNRYIIHCLGPVYGLDKPSDTLLSSCYRHALQLAEEHKIQSIAFPAISTGVFGFPLRPAARIALKTVLDVLPDLDKIKRIRFVLFSETDQQIFSETLSTLAKA